MPTPTEPAATGLRLLFDMAEAAGGQWTDGTLQLPASMGTGFIKLIGPEPGLMLAIHHYTLAREVVVRRLADDTQPETLLMSFHSFAPAPQAVLHLSTAQIATTNIGFTSTLPAQTAIFMVALAIDKALLATWLPGGQGLPAALATARYPVVLDTILTPEIQAVLLQMTAPRPAHALDAFFYKIKAQELLYWLFRELAQRAVVVPRPLHAADAERIFQVRAALLADLSAPPSLARLAQTAHLSETKLKQLFRQVFGTSPYAYYQHARLEEARRRLAHWSVSEVGYRLGFTNLGHFAHLFEKQHGLTPKKYQATLRR